LLIHLIELGNIMSNKKHLSQLPQKSFAVAPGDIVGGLIHIMDKPIGIEEGMVGISVDSQPYIEFINKRLNSFTSKKVNKFTNKPLKNRFEQLLQEKNMTHAQFDMLSSSQKISMLIHDQVHQTIDVNSEMQLQNVGLGGLLFKEYKKFIGVKPNDKFFKEIEKFNQTKNKVYMVKQDSPMVLGGSGPTIKNINKTKTAKKREEKFSKSNLGLLSFVPKAVVLAQRAFYLAKGSSININKDVIKETMATKIANLRGMPSQEIDVIKGTYADNSIKYCNIVTWTEGLKDLTGHLRGSASNDGSVCVALGKNNQPLKMNRNQEIIEAVTRNNHTVYQKYTQDMPTPQLCSEAEYTDQDAVFLSDHNIEGLGESLLTMLNMGDRDGIGKSGQNKGIRPLLDSQGQVVPGKFQFFGIDFGKAYDGENKLLNGLQDDFSFDNNAKDANKSFVNYSNLYDNPLIEKMKGAYLLATLRGKLSLDAQQAIAQDYANRGDINFANKLTSYIASVNAQVKDAIADDNSSNKSNFDDISLIQHEQQKYLAMANQALNKKDKKHYLALASSLEDIANISQQSDNKILDTFKKRISLLPEQIEILDNMEKLTAHQAYTHTPDGTVQLNHIRVEQNDRTPWQLEKNVHNKNYTLYCDTSDNKVIQAVKTKLASAQKSGLIPATLTLAPNNGIRFENVTPFMLSELTNLLTEDKVAKHRGLSYRSAEKRAWFNQQVLNLTTEQNSTPKQQPSNTLLHTDQDVFYDALEDQDVFYDALEAQPGFYDLFPAALNEKSPVELDKQHHAQTVAGKNIGMQHNQHIKQAADMAITSQSELKVPHNQTTKSYNHFLNKIKLQSHKMIEQQKPLVKLQAKIKNKWLSIK